MKSFNIEQVNALVSDLRHTGLANIACGLYPTHKAIQFR